MKTVLCYGDSLTWGYDAEGRGRHAFADRWPSTLQAELGSNTHVMAEGLNGRTTAFDDSLAGDDRNGARILPTILSSHAPLDLVIIMLGSNDMKPWIHGRALAAAQGMRRLAQISRSHAYPNNVPPPKLILVSPPHVSRTDNTEFTVMFAGGNEASKKLAPLYQAVAAEMGCAFFDAATIATTTPLDGVHLDAYSTRALGTALAPLARELLDIKDREVRHG